MTIIVAPKRQSRQEQFAIKSSDTYQFTLMMNKLKSNLKLLLFLKINMDHCTFGKKKNGDSVAKNSLSNLSLVSIWSP